jgi:hypothetical protein
VRRYTVKDPVFYDQFFALVQGYVNQERLSQVATRPAGNEASAQQPGEGSARGSPLPAATPAVQATQPSAPNQ